MRKRMTAAAILLAMTVCLSACSGTGDDTVVTGEPAAVQTSESSEETAATEETAQASQEDISAVYYSYADLLRENRAAIQSYEEARDKAGGNDVSDAVAAVCDVTEDGMPELIFISKGEESDSGYFMSVYTHVGNQNRRIGYFPVFDGSADSTFCAFQDSDSSDLCLFTGSRNEISERVYSYVQYELSGSDLSAVMTASKTEGSSVTYTLNGHDAGESDFYKQRKRLLDGVHRVLLRSARGFNGDPWNTFIQADSLGMNYDDVMYYLDHTYVPDESEKADSTEGQLFPDSGSRYIFNDDLKDLSDSDIQRAVNEIYARHGMIFNDSSVTDFFKAFSWYNPQTAQDSFDEDEELNDYEKANISFMQQYLRTKEAADREASEEAARKASEEAARQASEEAARKASEEAARKATEEAAAKKASEQKAQEAAQAQQSQQSQSGSSENSGSGSAGQTISVAAALSQLQGAVGTSIDGHQLQYEFTATVNDSSGRQYYAFTVTRMEGGAWVFYHNYLVAVDGSGYTSDSSQSGRPSYQHGSAVTPAR